MSGALCDKKIPPKVKGKIHKMVVQPAMLYAMETVSVTSSQVKKLKVAEMKMCRWACGFTRMDHVRNEDLLDKVEVEVISVTCQKSWLRWYGHVKRREQHNVCKRTLEAMPPAKRKRGRPRLRWMDCVGNDMKIIGVTENDASNRENRRRRVQDLPAIATLQQSRIS